MQTPTPILRISLLTLLSTLLLVGCNEREPQTAPYDDSATANGEEMAGAFETDRQTAFRVRADFDASLNSNYGWATDINQPATVQADQPFRLRFEVTSGDSPEPRSYRLQTRRNGGEWQPLLAEDFPYPQKLDEWPLDAAIGRFDPIWQFEQGSAVAMRWQAEGHLRIETGQQPLLALGQSTIQWQPSEFAVVLRLPDDPDARAGVVFTHNDGVFAWAELTNSAIRVLRVADQQTTVLAEHRTELTPGRWMELKMIFKGPGLKVELDDETLIEIERLPLSIGNLRLGVYLPENSLADFRSFVSEGESSTPRTSILSASTFAHGTPTEDVLSVSPRPFTGGAGVSFAQHAPAWAADGGHGEWSFPIVIRHFADGAVLNEDGDRFDYRLVDAKGQALHADPLASVTLAVPDGHLGGTFVETPMRVGPWQAANGALYFIMEPSETWNRMMMVRSLDGGRSWREIDGANRPDTGDLEGLGSVLADGRIHILHQTSDEVLYHVFNAADQTERPNAWAIRDERVATPLQPPTQVADLTVRSDGSVVAVYGAGNSIRYRVRSAGGSWGEEYVVDGPDQTIVSGPSVVLGSHDVVHLAYTASDGSAWYRRIGSDDNLSEAVQFASDLATGDEDVGAILPLLHLAESDSIGIVYRNRDGRLHERRVNAQGMWTEAVAISPRAVVQNAVDSDQTGADAVAFGDAIHALFVEDETGYLFHTSGRNGEWREAERVVDDVNVQWVRGRVVQSPYGEPVYGFVYDAGSNGGSGMNRYGEIPLR
ncbi:MAG: hypothetical protein AAF446_00010 [Pseudomonadota bacterium]